MLVATWSGETEGPGGKHIIHGVPQVQVLSTKGLRRSANGWSMVILGSRRQPRLGRAESTNRLWVGFTVARSMRSARDSSDALDDAISYKHWRLSGSSGKHRQVKILRSSLSGRESQETPGKFSVWLRSADSHKVLVISLRFSPIFMGEWELCGWPRSESSFWGALLTVPGRCSRSLKF